MPRPSPVRCAGGPRKARSVVLGHRAGRRLALGLGLIGLAVAALPSAPAFAQERPASLSSEDKQKLKASYEAATTHFNRREYDAAIALFSEAHQISQDPAFLFNIAQSYWHKKDCFQAILYYRRFLNARPQASNRKTILGRIAECEARIAQGEQPSKSEDTASSPSRASTSPAAVRTGQPTTQAVESPARPAAGTVEAKTALQAAAPPATSHASTEPAEPPAAPFAVTASPPIPHEPPSVVVELESKKKPIQLFQQTVIGRNKWDSVCDDICRLTGVDSSHFFRIAGPGIPPSRKFHLPAGSKRVLITGRGGSRGLLIAGAVLVSLGGALMLGGGIPALASGYSLEAAVLGIVVVAPGAILLITGAPLLGVGVTRVKIEDTWNDRAALRIPLGRGVALDARGLVF